MGFSTVSTEDKRVSEATAGVVMTGELGVAGKYAGKGFSVAYFDIGLPPAVDEQFDAPYKS